MRIDNLFKRFLKDRMLFGGEISKSSLFFMDEYKDAFMPFNSFRWDLTSEGHSFWFEQAAEWIMYLYINRDNIDKEDVKKYSISIENFIDGISDLVDNYAPDVTEKELMKIDAYSALKGILATVSS